LLGRSGSSRNAKPYPAVFRGIREIVVPTDRGAMRPEYKAVSGSFAVQIRAIVVPTSRGEIVPERDGA